MSLANGKADEKTIALNTPDGTRGAEGTRPTETPEGVRAFDQNGQEVIVPREEWRTAVLPGLLREVWEQPDHLSMLIVNSLTDGFAAEVAEAAAHLRRTDPIEARGVCMWAIVLTMTGQLDAAERELEGYTAAHGEDGSILVNLAKVYDARGERARAEATLWRGLQVEPNQDHGLGWFTANAQEQGGDRAAQAALEQVAKLPRSWRAQAWLGRAALAAGHLPRAGELYAEALANAPRPVPPDLLMQMSGDLGGRGHLRELLEWTAPHFVPEVHGLPIGNNLIKASMDLGNLDFAATVKNALSGFDRPDWKAALEFWDAEIARRRAGAPTGEAAGEMQIQIGMLRIDGPVWLPPGSRALALFGAKASGPVVTFLGGSAETPEPTGEADAAHRQSADALGRLTRALPLYLAEQVEMRTAASGRSMLPWGVGQSAGQPSGFVVSGTRWPDETALQAVGDPANSSEYVVTVHVDAEVEPWEASLVFVRAADGVRIGELSAEFAPAQPEDGLPSLADEVVELLHSLGPVATPSVYQVPAGANFGAYLLRLEQLLAVRCATMEGVSPEFLQGEQQMLHGNLQLCQAQPGNIPARLLLVETMSAVASVKPEAAEAFHHDYEQFQQQHPLPAVDDLVSSARISR